MKLATGPWLLWLSLGGVLALGDPSPKAEESYSDWGLRHIRGSFESVNSYFDSFLELLGGKNGICQYRCRFGKCRTCLLCHPSPPLADLPGSGPTATLSN
jgi:secretory phospholipase A2